jgi:hypothetical protein
VNVALYITIWIALGCFVAAEAGRRPALTGRPPSRWTSPVSAIGLVLLVVHIALAFDVRHGWSHAAAVESTARQTVAVYGLDWGGGIYVNYLFAGVWAVDAWLWHTAAASSARRPRAVVWALRAFYAVIIVNGAVIFVPGPRRWLGIALALAMMWTWRELAVRR